MDALLILGGLLLMVVSVVWLVALAFGTSLLWGVGSLIPPITFAYVFAHWNSARKAIGLFGLGTIPLVVGFSLMASQAPERFEAIVGLQWLEPSNATQGDSPALGLHGQLYGRSFNPTVATFSDGVLTLREGDDPFARQELVIRFEGDQFGGLQVDILPEDANPPASIEISWTQPEQDLPEARNVQNGYTLHLDLQRIAPDKLAGDFHLVLPVHLRTSVSGSLELFADGLTMTSVQAAPIAEDVPSGAGRTVSANAGDDPRPAFTLQQLLRDPQRYVHSRVRAHTERGAMAEGQFVGIDQEGNLAIRHLLRGSGEAVYNLAPDEIVLLELLEP